MKTNYHTHTSRCNHAGGTDEEYVKYAIETGVTELGFSDHVPQPAFTGIFESWFRMRPEETEDYCRSIRSLEEKYADRINVRLGFEVEYYPDCFKALREHLKPFAPDYFILGQHFINNEYDGVYVSGGRCTRETLEKYTKQVCEAVKTGLFSCIAHPDLPSFDISDPYFYDSAAEICLAAKNEGIPVELNLLGIQGNRCYPKKEFFKVAKEVGCDVILGLDAHSPNSFLCEEHESYARKLLSEAGIAPLEKLELRRPL